MNAGPVFSISAEMEVAKAAMKIVQIAQTIVPSLSVAGMDIAMLLTVKILLAVLRIVIARLLFVMVTVAQMR